MRNRIKLPEYLSILRDASVVSIYMLFLIVIIFSLIRGRIKDNELAFLYYIWLPIAVIAQSLMTYTRLNFEQSNLPIMNVYLIFEFCIIVLILLRIREREKKLKINFKLWIVIITAGVLTHFIYDFASIHNASMLYIAIVYFQLSVNYIDLNNVEQFFINPYSLLHITIFIKAFGYSYFLIYQTDYTFPLSIYSGVNLLVQIMLILTLIQYYRLRKFRTVKNDIA